MILLDTQVVVWTVGRPERLSRPARRVIERNSRSSSLAVASVTLMELAQLAARGTLRLRSSPAEWLAAVMAEGRFRIREITTEIAAVAAHLPPGFPADPFDRLIAATAIVERMPLVTADARIQASRVVETVW